MFYPFNLDSSVIIIGVAPSCLYLQGWGVAWRRMDDKLLWVQGFHPRNLWAGAVTDQARQLYNMKWWVNIGNIRGWSGWKEWRWKPTGYSVFPTDSSKNWFGGSAQTRCEISRGFPPIHAFINSESKNQSLYDSPVRSHAAENAAVAGSPAWAGPAVASVDSQWPWIQHRLGYLSDAA